MRVMAIYMSAHLYNIVVPEKEGEDGGGGGGEAG